MTALAKKPLCGHCDDGWLADDDGNLLARCPCRETTTPQSARDKGIAATAEANPEAMKAALAIIRETALSQPALNANDVRQRMRIAQVPGETVGAAFRQAAKDRVLRKIGYVASTDVGTHSHPVADWASLIYRNGARG